MLLETGQPSVKRCKYGIDLGFGDGQRRRHQDVVHPQPHHSSGLIDRLMQPFHCGVVHRGFGGFVTDQFDAGHQPVAAAHIADDIIFSRQFKRALIQLGAPRRSVCFGVQAQGFRQAGQHGSRFQIRRRFYRSLTPHQPENSLR